MHLNLELDSFLESDLYNVRFQFTQNFGFFLFIQRRVEEEEYSERSELIFRLHVDEVSL
jgi:hypothetical protein